MKIDAGKLVNTESMDTETALFVIRALAGRSLHDDPVAKEARRQALDVLEKSTTKKPRKP
jgi:hypothetical protein